MILFPFIIWAIISKAYCYRKTRHLCVLTWIGYFLLIRYVSPISSLNVSRTALFPSFISLFYSTSVLIIWQLVMVLFSFNIYLALDAISCWICCCCASFAFFLMSFSGFLLYWQYSLETRSDDILNLRATSS